MNAPDISIILPVYNAGLDFGASLKRLERTRTDNSEIIIVDDGSNDGTAETISEFARTRDYVFATILESNSGVAAARNVALRQARGTYVWFVDWDDEWDEEILRIMLARARQSGANAVVCRSRWRLDTGIDLGYTESIQGDITQDGGYDAFDHLLLGSLKGYLWSKLLRRDLLPADMFPVMRSRSDFCGLVPVLASIGAIAFEPRTLYYHVVRSGSLTNSREPRLDDFECCIRIVEKTAASLPSNRKRERLVLNFVYETISAGRVNTALRLSSPATVQRELANASERMRFRDISRFAIVSPRTAFRCALIKIFGRHFSILRGYFVASRNLARSVRASTGKGADSVSKRNPSD